MDLVNRDKTRIDLLFPTPIYVSEITNKEAVNLRLKASILELKAEYDAAGFASPDDYVNGYTTYFSQKRLQADQRFREIGEFILWSLQNFAANFGYDPQRRQVVLTGLWVNIQHAGSFHGKHIHSGQVFSGVYYVEAPPDSGRLRLYDPKETARMAEPSVDRETPLNLLQVELTPSSGTIVIFPGYLQHQVLLHRPEAPRISMSFNACFKTMYLAQAG